MAFSVVTPLMAPVALVYFFTAWVSARYCVLYIFERNFESGGLMWPVVFTQVGGALQLHAWLHAATKHAPISHRHAPSACAHCAHV